MSRKLSSVVLLWLAAGQPTALAILSVGARRTDATVSKHDSATSQTINRDFGFGENHLNGGGAGGGGGGAEGYGEAGLGAYGEGYDDGNYHGYSHGFDHHKEEHHKHHGPSFHKALAIKGLLIPLAGVALLGAAAAFVSNPILLQLGVISGTYGRRRRRDTNNNPGLDIDEATARLEARIKLGEIQLLERFMAQVPKEEMQSQEKRLLASYLTCSGAGDGNSCLERLTCELHSAQGSSMPVETHVMSIVANEILDNELIPETIKERMSRAMQVGRGEGNCEQYSCQQLEG